MKKINDKSLVAFLWKNVMSKTYLAKEVYGDHGEWWDPLEKLPEAWAMHAPLRDAQAYEFPLFLTLADDGGMYYRANVHHEYDFTLIASAVDEKYPCRAVCMAVYTALKALKSKKIEKSGFWQMHKKPETPKVGVGVFIKKDDMILLGQRKGAHGEGQWSLPGGHMELGEDFVDVCAREVAEETGIIIKGAKKVGFTNDIFPKDGLHYVTLFFEALWDGRQEPQLKEPDKTVEWRWFKPGALPDNLFPPLVEFLTGCP